VIGAGPAGLTAALELCRAGAPVTVLEKDAIVGGIARTEQYKGYSFDIGGHRFFTKIGEVEALWHEILGPEFITRPRISRIYYRGKFFDYPLKAANALRNLGVFTSVAVVASWLRSQIAPYPREDNLEEWVSNRFGRKLYSIFFKTYTEKVWGIPCTEIRAEWAAQRIKGLSLAVAVKNALFGNRGGDVETLIDEFQYPRLGPGMMWRRAAELVESKGGAVELEWDAESIRHASGRVLEVVARHRDGRTRTLPASHVLSSMPISELVRKLDPAPPAEIRDAASRLTYRDFITVVLIVDRAELFPDNWIYVHTPDVKLGRVQNFKNWSPEMVPDPAKTSLGLEYFCSEGDELWRMSDAELVELGKREMQQIGLVRAAEVSDATVVRQRKAYPVYDATYATHLETLKRYLESFSNLHTMGRNGLHKYNNQDHSMLTAMLCVRNVLGEHHDVWDVNTERSYHEEVRIPKAAPA